MTKRILVTLGLLATGVIAGIGYSGRSDTTAPMEVGRDLAGTPPVGLPSGAALDPATVTATVTRCSDGDTCHIVTSTPTPTTVSPSKLWFNVRLAGIDAPEIPKKRGKYKSGQEFGIQAHRYLSDAVMGKQVVIRQTDLDQYNRPVVELFLGERNINLEMVSMGYAEAYRGKTKRLDSKAYLNAETAAKAEKVGIWGLKNYESPADFRKKFR